MSYGEGPFYERTKIVYQVFNLEHNGSLGHKCINIFPYMINISLILQTDVPELIGENYLNIAVSLHELMKFSERLLGCK